VCCAPFHIVCQCYPTGVQRHIVGVSSKNLGKNRNFYKLQEISNGSRNIKESFWLSVGTTGVVSARFQLLLCFVFVLYVCENHILRGGGGPPGVKVWEIFFLFFWGLFG